MLKVNFQVLFGAQGLNLTTEEVEESKISTSIALQLPIKCFMIQSIIEVPHIIPEFGTDKIKRTVNIPELQTL